LNYEGRSLPEDIIALELSRITDKAAVPDLIAILQSDPKAALEAIEALGEIGDVSALPAVAAHLGDSDQFVRYQASVALEKMTNSSAYKSEP
jgi:HEAT repeat protein